MSAIRIHSKPSGIPRAQVIVTGGETELGAVTTVLRVSALDSYGIPEVVATLRLSPAEALDLAERLQKAAQS